MVSLYGIKTFRKNQLIILNYPRNLVKTLADKHCDFCLRTSE